MDISQLISKKVSSFFNNVSTFSNTDVNAIYSKLTRRDNHLINIFINDLQNSLIYSNFDIHFSGSTFLLLFIINNHIITSNIGDSRAILISNNSIIPLSSDHKPLLPREKERIEKNNGVTRKEYPDGPDRVWCQNENFPGIAMSRSMGDLVAKEIGVSNEEEISIREISKNDKYIVLASDCLWDNVDNGTVKQIVDGLYLKNDAKGAVYALIEEASRRFEEQNEARDDITVIVYFFNH